MRYILLSAAVFAVWLMDDNFAKLDAKRAFGSSRISQERITDASRNLGLENLAAKWNESLKVPSSPKSFSRYWHLVSGSPGLMGAPATSSASSAFTIRFNLAEISSRPAATVIPSHQCQIFSTIRRSIPFQVDLASSSRTCSYRIIAWDIRTRLRETTVCN
jgi:hypothetical protein